MRIRESGWAASQRPIVFGYPKRQAALVTLETIGRWLAAHPDSRLRIVISLNADVDVAAYEAALAPPPWRP